MTKTRDLADWATEFPDGEIRDQILTFTQSGTGATQRTVESKLQDVVSVKDFGAVGDGTTDDTAAIQAALDYAKPLGITVLLPEGEYLISSSLTNNSNTASNLYPSTPNGIIMEGVSKGSKLIASASFPLARGMVEIDSNPEDEQDFISGTGFYVNVGNRISNLVFDGNDRATNGLVLRGTYYNHFEHLIFENFEGDNGPAFGAAAVAFNGVTASTKDDVDTVGTSTFKNVIVQNSAGHGFIAIRNRPSHIVFENVWARNIGLTGWTMCGAFISFNNCLAVNCGNRLLAGTGGYKVVRGATQAETRVFNFYNCGFENNYLYDWDIQYCNVFNIIGCGGSPFTRTGSVAAGQGSIKIGKSGLDVKFGTITGNRWQPPGGVDPNRNDLPVIDIGADASNIDLANNSIDSLYNDPIIQNSSAIFITRSSRNSDTTSYLEPVFRVNGDTSAFLTNINSRGQLSFGRTNIIANGNAVAFQMPGTAGDTTQSIKYNTTTGTVYSFKFTNGSNTDLGSISHNLAAGTTAFATSSDYRLKEDLQPISDSWAKLAQINPCNFRWKASNTRSDGFIAHELQAVIPEAVVGDKDAVDDEGNPMYQGIDQSKIVPVLTAALQEAVQKIKDLESRLTTLETN